MHGDVPGGGEAAGIRRLGIIGDVHAEDQRLETALRAMASLSLDVIACTGDIVDGRGSAARCCDLLQQHRVRCVRGNHDRWLFSGLLRDAPFATQLADLSPLHQSFLRSLPEVEEIATVAGSVLLCHGIGRFDLEKVTSYDTEYSLRTNPRLQQVLAGGKHRVIANGHSHERLVLDLGSTVLVNAGSLSDADDAGFALLDFDSNIVEWVRVEGGEAHRADTKPLFRADRFRGPR